MDDSRRIVVIDGSRRLDLAIPTDGTIGDALYQVGVTRDGGRLPLVANGLPTDPDTLVKDLTDGSLFAVVDPEAIPASGAADIAKARIRQLAGPWWAQGAIGVTATAIVLAGGYEPVFWVPLAFGVLAVLGAFGVAQYSTKLGSAGRTARILGPTALAAAAISSAVPFAQVGGGQLVVVSISLVTTVLLALAITIDPSQQVRDALGTAAVISVTIAVIWGTSLLLSWPVAFAAAVTVGGVPLALRALPTTLLDIPDGYFIDFDRYMTTRWSPRGKVPPPPGSIDGENIKEQVLGANAARVTGTLLMSVIGAVALPFAVSAPPLDGFTIGGQIALLIAYPSAMVLLGRSAGIAGLHWAPRISALVAVALGVGMIASADSQTWILVTVVLAIVAALVTSWIAVALGRGASSLVISRIGDWTEALTLALSLPSALLAAGGLEIIRGMAG